MNPPLAAMGKRGQAKERLVKGERPLADMAPQTSAAMAPKTLLDFIAKVKKEHTAKPTSSGSVPVAATPHTAFFETGTAPEAEDSAGTTQAAAARVRNSQLRGYKADAEKRRQHDREHKQFVRALERCQDKEYIKEWGDLCKQRSNVSKGLMTARWKASGKDFAKMRIRDRIAKRKLQAHKKTEVWKTHDELMIRFNQNVELVESLEARKTSMGLTRPNPDCPHREDAVQYRLIGDDSLETTDEKFMEQEIGFSMECEGEAAEEAARVADDMWNTLPHAAPSIGVAGAMAGAPSGSMSGSSTGVSPPEGDGSNKPEEKDQPRRTGTS